VKLSRQVTADGARVVPMLPPRVPVLHAEDLPGADDWAVLSSLTGDRDDALDADIQYDRFGSLMLAPDALD
jgi:hypothetical protein